MTAKPLLHIENLSVSMASAAGPVPIIQDLTLSIQPGEILGLAGESGCGKSTLAKAILRILPPPAFIHAGHIWYQGQDILDFNPQEMQAFRWRDASMVFQNALNALNPVLRIREQLLDTLLCHKKMPQRIAQLCCVEKLQMVGLDKSHMDRYPHELSGGMRQRVMIAMALLLEAPLLILDEPTTALDVIVQRDILQKIVELQSTLKFSVLFVTHDLPLMAAFCDRMAILYAGRIVESGISQLICDDPLHPYTQGLMASFPSLDGERRTKRGIMGQAPGFDQQTDGCRFLPRCIDRCAEGLTQAPVLKARGSRDHEVACHQSHAAP